MKKIKLIYVTIFVFLFTMVLTGCEKAPEPIIKEGKFNFSVTYEVDGETKTISSVFVCNFIESSMYLDGYYIDWESYIEDREIEELFPEQYHNCIIVKTNEYGNIYLDLNLYPQYFMSEPGYDDSRSASPSLFVKYHEDKVEEVGTYGTDDLEIIESYGVKIISYEYDKPIENIYK